MLTGEKKVFRARIWSTALLVTLFLFTSLSAAAENKLSIPSNSSCACPNKDLMFNCSVVGGGATVWTGSAFSCSTNEIILRHNRFTEGTTGVCNDGAIVGQSLGIENNCSTSQLTVSVSSELNSRTVMCLVNSDAGMTQIGETTLTVITAPVNEVPSGVQLTKVEPGRLTFIWNAVNTNCPSINYRPNPNCTWSCDTTTDTTTAVCSGLQLPSVCTFTVQTEVCGQVGLPSEQITVTLRVPDKPVVNIIPVYSAGTQGLLQIKAEIYEQAPFNITDTVSVSVTSYNISYNSAKPVTFDRNTSCVESTCAYLIDVSSDLCQLSSNVSVALSASNRLGQGPTSDPTKIGCTNGFVQVEYDRMTSTITCRFLDETDTSVKSCNVTYGQCGQELVQPGQLGNYSTMEAPNIVYLKLPVDGGSLKCYNVTASSDLSTVIVQALGSIVQRNDGADVAAIVVPVIAVFIMAIVVPVIVLILVKMSRRKQIPIGHVALDSDDIEVDDIAMPKGSQLDDNPTNIQFDDHHYSDPDNMEQISLNEINKLGDPKTVMDIDELPPKLREGNIKKYNVSQDCKLIDFVENEIKVDFKRGCAFYEFVHDFEDISEDKEVLLVDNDDEHGQLYSPIIDSEKQCHSLIGPKVPKPRHKGYKVFVQSTGSGARHLPAGSILYYEFKDSSNVPRAEHEHEPPLKPIICSHFEVKTLTSDVTVKEYNEMNNCNVFLELGTFKKTSEVIDVIMQDKKAESETQLYTGPTARKIVQEHYKRGGTEGFDKEKWRVFVLCKRFDIENKLKSGTKVLQYKKTEVPIDDFHVLTAGQDEECSSLSNFVEQKLGGEKFINGHAFYEFKREEDLQFYKEAIFWETKTDKLKSSIVQFYNLHEVPAMGVKPPIIEDVRVFIQSTSQGARCVKPGDTILYKIKEVASESTDPHKEHIYENAS